MEIVIFWSVEYEHEFGEVLRRGAQRDAECRQKEVVQHGRVHFAHGGREATRSRRRDENNHEENVHHEQTQRIGGIELTQRRRRRRCFASRFVACWWWWAAREATIDAAADEYDVADGRDADAEEREAGEQAGEHLARYDGDNRRELRRRIAHVRIEHESEVGQVAAVAHVRVKARGPGRRLVCRVQAAG